MKKIVARREIGLALAVTLLACVAAAGQQDKKFAQAQQENAKKLRQYSWKSRTEVRKGGETKSTQLYLMRYDIEGAPQQTLVSGTSQQIPTRGLRGLIAKKKKEEFVETLNGLGALAKSYGNLSPDRVQRFMADAAVTPEKTSRQTLIRIQGRDVLQPGDSMTVWVDAATRKQRRVEIETTFDRKPVRIVSEFQDLPDGPTYVARSVVDYPSKELTITTENFDYTRGQQ
jgi:outer membrane lipoprotein-sorting protein